MQNYVGYVKSDYISKYTYTHQMVKNVDTVNKALLATNLDK